MFIIGEAVIDDDVSEASFCCDLEICKGACCYIDGGRGAPLEDDEVLEINKALPVVKTYLPERSLQTIATSGPVEGAAGNYATNCVENKECVFVLFEHGIAKCSFEKAFEVGEIDWRKPLSCHLFPLRIRKFGKDFIHYEMIAECDAGRQKGRTNATKLHDFLKEPLVRRYGEGWYEKLRQACKTKQNHDVV